MTQNAPYSAGCGNRPARVAIVEDDASWAKEVAQVLNASPDFNCVGIHPTGESALIEIPKIVPDVVLMDLNLPGISGCECIRELKNRLPDVAILVLTAFAENDLVFESLRLGADGYLLKRSRPDELLQAIFQVRNGGSPMTSVIARKVVEHFRIESAGGDSALASLSNREHEILGCLAKGGSYKGIAYDLNLSIDTIRMHIRGIYRKLHVHSRGEAVARFFGKT